MRTAVLILSVLSFLPYPALGACLRKPRIFPEGDGWLRMDVSQDYTFWWRFQPPRAASFSSKTGFSKIGRVIMTSSGLLKDKKSFAKFVRYQHIEFDCSRTSNEESYERVIAYSFKPNGERTVTDEQDWELVEGSNIHLGIAAFACRESSVSRIKADGSVFGVKSGKYTYFSKKECPL